MGEGVGRRSRRGDAETRRRGELKFQPKFRSPILIPKAKGQLPPLTPLEQGLERARFHNSCLPQD
ncbi:MAG: hypothetical protein F6K58_28180 [Symploca sp. SIO2E9]|nr:hypothetical protein [Symploca sp. SIO2E9]